MRIDRLDLKAYGPFTDKSLDLSNGELGLHLIYGDNEAGKSTSLRAFIAWLFGIPARTNDNFLHKNSQLRIEGKLRLSNGKEIEFTRKKGNKGTLLKYGTNESLNDDILEEFLPSGIDENIYTKLWGIDHSGLVAGGQELLNQSGDLGQALFSAAVGTASLRKILTALQSSAEDIFKPLGKKSTLKLEISNFKDAQRRMKDMSLPVSDWKKLQKDLSDVIVAIEHVEKDIESKSVEKSRLDRLNRVKETLVEHSTILGKIDELGELLLLPEDFEEKRKTASDNLQSATIEEERLNTKRAKLEGESKLELLSVRNELLENEDTILALYGKLSAVKNKLIDRQRLDGERQLLLEDAETLLKGVRPDIDLGKADDLRPLLNNKSWISKLEKKHGLLMQKKEQYEGTLRKTKNEQESLRNQFGDIPQSELDLKELKATIAAARKAGEVEVSLTEAQKRSVKEKAACENERTRLGRFTETVESLLELAMPVSETLDTFEKENDELSEKLKDNIRKLHETKEGKEQAEQELKALLLTSDVPTIAELEASRDARNTGWSLIKRKYIKKIDIEKDISKYAPDSDLPTIYEQKVDYADNVSDRLRLAVDQVLKRADLEAKIENLQSRLNSLSETVEKVNDTQKAYQERWVAIWEPLGIDAGTPREMKQWLLRAEKLVVSVQVANAVAGDEQNLTEKCNRLKKEVSTQITKFDTTLDHQSMSLEALIVLCEQRVEDEEGVRERRQRLEDLLNEAKNSLERTQVELNSIDMELSNWLEEWGQAIEGLGLSADVYPERATETFSQLLSFFDRFDKSEDLRKQIDRMDQDKKKFEETVLKFVHRISFERDGQDVAIIVNQLQQGLTTAREARARFTKIQTQLKEKNEEIKDANITIRTSKEQLTLLRDQAGVDRDEELIKVGESSRIKRELKKNLNMLVLELNRHGDGLSIEKLEKELDESDIDSIEGEVEKITIDLREFREKRDSLRDEKQKLQSEIEAKDDSAVAANASEEAEEYLASMVSNAEQYLRLQIAVLILKQRIEDYRKKNQAPVLARASELFSKLTLGSYVGLRDEFDDNTGNPILLGVQPDDKEVLIDRMSDGTRDQLYLALRLATLEQHLSKGEPVPFVVDDILIGFDDNRTRACLKVLAELAASTQILMFTHHRRVLELARPIKSKAGIFIHELA